MESKKGRRVLRTRADFLLLKAQGKRISPAPWILLVVRKNSTEDLRLGITLSKKVGSAVLRNRLRRWTREFFRHVPQKDSQVGLDINVVFRPMGSDFYRQLEHSEFDRVFQKALRTLGKTLAVDLSLDDSNI